MQILVSLCWSWNSIPYNNDLLNVYFLSIFWKDDGEYGDGDVDDDDDNDNSNNDTDGRHKANLSQACPRKSLWHQSLHTAPSSLLLLLFVIGIGNVTPIAWQGTISFIILSGIKFSNDEDDNDEDDESNYDDDDDNNDDDDDLQHILL